MSEYESICMKLLQEATILNFFCSYDLAWGCLDRCIDNFPVCLLKQFYFEIAGHSPNNLFIRPHTCVL